MIVWWLGYVGVGKRNEEEERRKSARESLYGGGGYDGLAGWRSNDSSAQLRDSFMKAPELSGTADDYPQGSKRLLRH